MVRRAAALIGTVLIALLGPAVPAAAEDDAPVFSVLVLTPAERRPEIVRAEHVLGVLERTYGLRLDVTHDPGMISPEGLAPYRTLMWVGVGGDVLGPEGEAALRAYVQGDGGFVVVTADSVDAEPDWDWYDSAVAVRVEPDGGQSRERTVSVAEDEAALPSAPGGFSVTDRWHRPLADPGTADAISLITYTDDDQADVSVAWAHRVGDGRVVVTSMGNDYDTWGEGDFVKVLRGGLWWASRSAAPIVVDAGDASPAWPYVLSFVLLIGAIATGGVIAVTRTGARRPPAGVRSPAAGAPEA